MKLFYRLIHKLSLFAVCGLLQSPVPANQQAHNASLGPEFDVTSITIGPATTVSDASAPLIIYKCALGVSPEFGCGDCSACSSCDSCLSSCQASCTCGT